MRKRWILLVVGVLAGCASPATRVDAVPVPASGPRFDAVVADLLARPLPTPRIGPGTACPVDESRPLGASPLYPTQRRLHIRPENTPGSDGLYDLKNLWFSSAGSPGPIVVRVARLDGDGRGLVRLYYSEASSRRDAVVFPIPEWDEDWPSGTFVSGPGCYAYQIDGVSFSETIVFGVDHEGGRGSPRR